MSRDGFFTERPTRGPSLRRPVDEAAMESKLKELRAAMAREKSAREGVRGMMAAGEGTLWQSSRPQALRVRNGNRKLRELSAEELDRIQRAKAAELPAGSALKMVRIRSAEARRRLDPLDHAAAAAVGAGAGNSAGPLPAASSSVPPGYHQQRGQGHGTERPSSSSSSSSSRPVSRSSVVEHVVVTSQQLHRRTAAAAATATGEQGDRGQTFAYKEGGPRQHQPRPPVMTVGGGSSRPSSRGGGGVPPAYPHSLSHVHSHSHGGTEYEPLVPPLAADDHHHHHHYDAVAVAVAEAGTRGGAGGGVMDELEELGGGGTGYLRGTRAGAGAAAAVAEEDAKYFPPGWDSGRRGGAEVLSLVGGGGGGYGGSSGGGPVDQRTTRGGVQIVNETISLLDGDFDEAANEASFAEALKEWRSGGRHDPARPTTASLATMEVQTEAPSSRVFDRPQTARPGAVTRPGASYFDRMYAANVERMAAKDAMDALKNNANRPASALARPASARPKKAGVGI